MVYVIFLHLLPEKQALNLGHEQCAILTFRQRL